MRKFGASENEAYFDNVYYDEAYFDQPESKAYRRKQYDDFLYIPIQTIEFTDSEDVIRVGE